MKLLKSIRIAAILAAGLMLCTPAFAYRKGDKIDEDRYYHDPDYRVQMFYPKTEAEADRIFDEGHARGYICAYWVHPGGAWIWSVMWLRE